MPNRALFAALLVVVAGIGTGAQLSPATFKSGVALMTMDVSVLDRDGRPVEGLGAEDFEITLDGRVHPVKIASFVVVATRPVVALNGSTRAPGALPPALPSAATMPVTAGEARVYVVLVDDLSFSPMRGKNLFTAAAKFIRGLPPQDLVGLTTTSGALTVNPSADRDEVLEAVRRVVGQFADPRTARPTQMGGGREGGFSDQPVGLMQALAIDRGDIGTLKDVIVMECFAGDRNAINTQSLAALSIENNCVAQIQREALRTAALTKSNTARQAKAIAAIIDVLRPVPGYKQMIVLTDGLAVGAETASLKPIAVAAARAGVRVSVLLEDQDMHLTDEGRRALGAGSAQQNDVGLAARRREDARLLMQGAQEATAMAGGHFFRITGDPDPFFDRAARAGSAVYRLGVEPPSGTNADRQFDLEARVKTRSGLSVAASRVAMIAEPAPAAPPPPRPRAARSLDERLKAALSADLEPGSLPMTISTALRRAARASANTALELTVSIEAAATVTGPLVTMFEMVDEQGRSNGGRRELPATVDGTPVSTSFVLPMAPGQYRFRLAAANAAGVMGATEVPITVQLATMGPVLASDLLTGWVDAKGRAQLFVTPTLPDGATSLRTSLELYASSAAPVEGLSVRWELTRVGDADPIEEREVTPRVVGAMFRADAEFDRALFAPGTYALRATVRQGESVLGRSLRTLTVSR